MSGHDEGTKVEWDWGNGTGTGTIKSKFTRKVTRTINGSEITRNGSEDDPAYYITQEDGGSVLKLDSEVRTAS